MAAPPSEIEIWWENEYAQYARLVGIEGYFFSIPSFVRFRWRDYLELGLLMGWLTESESILLDPLASDPDVS